jgi:hypothetical protein
VCSFIVLEGTVEVTPKAGGQPVLVPAGKQAQVPPSVPIAPITPQPAPAPDPFVLRNQARDGGGGPAGEPTVPGPTEVPVVALGETATVEGDKVTVSNYAVRAKFCHPNAVSEVQPPCRAGEILSTFAGTTDGKPGVGIVDMTVCRAATSGPLAVEDAFYSIVDTGGGYNRGQVEVAGDSEGPYRDPTTSHVQMTRGPLAPGACRSGFGFIHGFPGETGQRYVEYRPHAEGLEALESDGPAVRWKLS